jgi:T-complex protein 1 subunit gamma
VLDIVSRISIPIDTSDDVQMLALIERLIMDQFVSGPRVPLEAVRTVSVDEAGVRTVDIKRCVRVESVPDGEIIDSVSYLASC